MKDDTGNYTFKYNTTMIVVQYVMILIIMFERMEGLGELIMTISHIVQEFFRFLLTFGSLIVLFLVIYWTLKKDLRINEMSVFILVEDLIDALDLLLENLLERPDGRQGCAVGCEQLRCHEPCIRQLGR